MPKYLLKYVSKCQNAEPESCRPALDREIVLFLCKKNHTWLLCPFSEALEVGLRLLCFAFSASWSKWRLCVLNMKPEITLRLGSTKDLTFPHASYNFHSLPVHKFDIQRGWPVIISEEVTIQGILPVGQIHVGSVADVRYCKCVGVLQQSELLVTYNRRFNRVRILRKYLKQQWNFGLLHNSKCGVTNL